MGKVAMEYGDLIIATSDNPRSEEPLSILADIQQGLGSVYSVGKEYVVVIDRRAAIAKALQAAQADDVVIIAGKGHETYQILKDHTIHFDDREVVREIIREMK
jgi:UDP-N-acetylmuramyl tripeptide synthase